MDQLKIKRCGTSFGSAEPQEPYPLPCLNLITLITYQFSLLLFVCLACLWLAALTLTYPSPTPPYCTVVGLSTVEIFSHKPNSNSSHTSATTLYTLLVTFLTQSITIDSTVHLSILLRLRLTCTSNCTWLRSYSLTYRERNLAQQNLFVRSFIFASPLFPVKLVNQILPIKV
jgi:hypothetical protein